MSARFTPARRGHRPAGATRPVGDHLARLHRRQVIAGRLLIVALALGMAVGLVLLGLQQLVEAAAR